MNQAQIDKAVEACLERAVGDERPFRQIADFLAMLKIAGWSPEEILTVQNLVIEGMGRRLRSDGSGHP